MSVAFPIFARRRTGLFCAVDDAVDLSKKLARLILEPDLRCRLVERGIALVEGVCMGWYFRENAGHFSLRYCLIFYAYAHVKSRSKDY